MHWQLSIKDFLQILCFFLLFVYYKLAINIQFHYGGYFRWNFLNQFFFDENTKRALIIEKKTIFNAQTIVEFT